MGQQRWRLQRRLQERQLLMLFVRAEVLESSVIGILIKKVLVEAAVHPNPTQHQLSAIWRQIQALFSNRDHQRTCYCLLSLE